MFKFNVQDPVRVPFSPELQVRQEAELALQREWMKNPECHFAEENLAKGPPRLYSAGVELELPIVTKDGQLGDAGVVIDTYPETTTEFLTAAVEWISQGMVIAPDFLKRLADFHYEAWTKTSAALQSGDNPSYPMGIGYYPDGTEGEDAQKQLMCMRKPRYKFIDKCLVVRNGKGSLSMTNLEGEEVFVYTNGGPYVPGLAFSEHMNFCCNRPGAAANAAILSAASVIRLSASSPFVRSIGNEVIGSDCTRWPMWHLMGKSPFAIGNYYNARDVLASVEWSRFLFANAEMIVPFEASVYAGHPLGVTHYASGTMWMKTDRLRHGWDANRERILLRNENRTPDTQLSAHDSVAMFAFVLGLTQSLIKLLEHVAPNECMPYAIAERSACSVALWGHAATNWMGNRMSVEDLTRDVFLPMAKDGLDELGICPKDSEYFLSSIESRCNGRNGSNFLLRSFKKIEESKKWATRGEVVMEVLRRLAHRQSFQQHPLEDRGFRDWELL